MKVAVIGGAGKMGRWLVKHFLTQGHSVVISDLKRDEAEAFAERVGAEVAAGNLEAAEGADVVLVSVPIEITPKVLMDVAPNLKENAELVEIASLKTHIIPVLRKIAESRCVKTVSVHPLFGPGAKKLSEERIALIPVSNLEMEVKEAGRLFPGAEIIPVDAEIHDRIMALTLSVPHFINIAFTSLLGEENLEL
ncbi:prephenate dehydrogenase/arogenate dehydrogenase family protein, partial [Candidatus Bathyarchaeota archaeon]